MNDNDTNGRDRRATTEHEAMQPTPEAATQDAPDAAKNNGAGGETFARREKKAPEDSKRLLVVAAGFLFALVIFALAMMSAQRSLSNSGRKTAAANNQPTKPAQNNSGPQPSVTPVTDSAHATGESTEAGFATADDIARTATTSPKAGESFASSAKPGETLGSVPPFDAGETWQPPAYSAGAPTGIADAGESATGRTEREAMEKASLVFVRTVSGNAAERTNTVEAEPEVSLPPGTRLRARLESVASTATQAPVIAVVEYNYEQNGEIAVPAGAKAFGHVEQADRLGYVSVRFDSLMMPDGSMSKIEGVATDLAMRPLKGRVEGTNSGKNVLVRSFSGIGQAAAMLVGRGSLNQPLSESDLLRERLSSNIGQASDEELMKMAISERIVVSVPASTQIYVVLQRPGKRPLAAARGLEPGHHEQPPAKAPSSEELRQLLQLQRELNDQSTSKPPAL
jgi:hypothetical protein